MGVLISMVTITLIAVIVVIIKVILLQTESEVKAQTFAPMAQMSDSKIKYTGNGFIPCNG